ncbi:MAG: hypothetical protein ACRELG_28910 [Gemmataceae bacterium]
MTTDYRTQVGELQDQADGLPYGPSKLALMEEAVRLADTHQDVALGDEVRAKLITVANFSGYPEIALVAFSWRLAQADRSPELFPEKRLLWKYKWIANSLKLFPQISREQIEETLDDMARRYQRAGASQRPIFNLRWRYALHAGELDKAREYFRLWEKMPRDGNTDCLACEQNDRVNFHLEMGKRQKALKLAEPILRDLLRCAVIPHSTYANVLLPLVQSGQVEKAAEYHNKGYRLIRTNRDFLDAVGDHLTFLALTGNHAQGVKLFEKHLEWALESKDLLCCWRFYLGVHFFLSRLAESGQTSVKLRLPKATPCFQEEGRYEVAMLASWIEETCQDLAARFDARNGNDGFARHLAAQRRLKRWVTPYPLSRSRKGK